MRTLRPSLSPKTLTSGPREQLLDDDLASGVAEAQLGEAVVERSLRLLDAGAHDHALAEREPVGLDHACPAELGDERAEARAIVSLAGDPARRGDARRVHDLLRERLGRLDARRGSRGTEDGDAARVHASATPAAAAASGPMIDEVDRPFGGEPATAAASVTSTATFSAMRSGAAVARRHDDRKVRRVAPARPRQRVLASPGSDDEDSAYSHSIVDGGLLEMS